MPFVESGGDLQTSLSALPRPPVAGRRLDRFDAGIVGGILTGDALLGQTPLASLVSGIERVQMGYAQLTEVDVASAARARLFGLFQTWCPPAGPSRAAWLLSIRK